MAHALEHGLTRIQRFYHEQPVAPGEVVNEQYVIEALIGSGTFGQVYRARDRRLLDRPVALKLIHPARLSQLTRRHGAEFFIGLFRQEALALTRLNHPNIVTVLDFGTWQRDEKEPLPFLVTELLEGQTLAGRLNAGVLPPLTALMLTRQLLEALAHAHDRRLLHLDLKPNNLFVDALNRLKVLDFGLTRLSSTLMSPEREDATKQEQWRYQLPYAATHAYLPPEQRARRERDAGTDLYATALILLESLTGKPPQADITGTTGPLVLTAMGPLLPQALLQVVSRALHPVPDQRFGSAQDFLSALEDAESRLRSADFRRRLRRLGLGFAGMLLVLITLISSLAFFSVRQERDRARQERDRALNLERLYLKEQERYLKERDDAILARKQIESERNKKEIEKKRAEDALVSLKIVSETEQAKDLKLRTETLDKNRILQQQAEERERSFAAVAEEKNKLAQEQEKTRKMLQAVAEVATSTSQASVLLIDANKNRSLDALDQMIRAVGKQLQLEQEINDSSLDMLITTVTQVQHQHLNQYQFFESIPLPHNIGSAVFESKTRCVYYSDRSGLWQLDLTSHSKHGPFGAVTQAEQLVIGGGHLIARNHGEAWLFDAATGATKARIGPARESALLTAISFDGALAGLASAQSAELWDLTTGKAIGAAIKTPSRIRAIELDTKGIMWIGSVDGRLYRTDGTMLVGPIDRQPATTEPNATLTPIVAIKEIPGRRLLVAHFAHRVRLLDEDGTERAVFMDADVPLIETQALAYSAASGRLATAGKDGYIRLWYLGQRRAVRFREPDWTNNPPMDVHLSLDGRVLLVLTWDGGLRLYRLDPAAWLRHACRLQQALSPSASAQPYCAHEGAD